MLGSGGGGYGDPLRRDPDAVRRDVAERVVSAELAAAVYGASEGLTTVVLEADAIGGQAGASSMIRNYLGFPRGISGMRLAQRARAQAMRRRRRPRGPAALCSFRGPCPSHCAQSPARSSSTPLGVRPPEETTATRASATWRSPPSPDPAGDEPAT